MNINQLRNSFVILILGIATIMAVPVDATLQGAGNRCVSYVFDNNFRDAHAEADAVIRDFPKSSCGQFLKASVYHYQMVDLGEKEYSRQFYAACDKAVELGEDAPDGPAGEWDRFFMAGSLGIRGAYERSRNRLVTSLKLGWRAIDVFRPLKSSGNIDAVYGVAVYDFWVGANLPLLWWMDGATDERPRALRDLIQVKSEGVFTSEVVLYDLLEMYTNEKNYREVINISQEILTRHPLNSTASEYLFQAQIELELYNDAKNTLIARTEKLRERGAPNARYIQLGEDWATLKSEGGLDP